MQPTTNGYNIAIAAAGKGASVTFLGEFAAIGAALSFGFASTLFTLAGRKYGALLVMQGSVPVGWLCIIVVNLVVVGHIIPANIEPANWLWLTLSGMMGFWLASICVMSAFIRIGPRLTLLIASINPILSAVLAWLFLDQNLQSAAVLGIIITIAGIALVVTEGGTAIGDIPPERFRSGILFALLASTLQATSFVLSTLGLSTIVDPLPQSLTQLVTFTQIDGQIPYQIAPLTASLIRLTSGSIILWVIAGLQGKIRQNLQTLRAHPVALRQLMVAAVLGTVIGALLILIALQNAPVGIATTLINLTPIFLIPIGYVVFKERISMRAVAGTLVAMVGIVVLFV